MNTKQINKLFKNNLNYLGTFPKDLLQSSSKNKFGLIINTDNSDMPGEHWVAIFKNNNKVEYFDSFGLPPLQEEIAITCLTFDKEYGLVLIEVITAYFKLAVKA